MKFTIALAQIDSILGDIQKNVNKHIQYIRRAKEGGAALIVFPELSLTGYSIKDLNWEVALKPDNFKLVQPLLDESNEITILAGGAEESKEFSIYNSAFLFEKGSLQVAHRKIYPPTYGLFEELRYFSPGQSIAACDSLIGKIGVLICEDLWHLPLPYLVAQDGASIIIGMAASPTRVGPEESQYEIGKENLENHKSYARLLSSYVVFCNRVGYEDGINFWGGSEVIHPSGEVIMQARLFDEDLIFAEIDDNEIRRARQFSRHFLDDNVHIVRRELRRISDHWRSR